MAVSVSISPSSGNSNEDTLLLQMQSSTSLPLHLSLRYSEACSTSVRPSNGQDLAGLALNLPSGTKLATWTIVPGQLAAGPLCLALVDRTSGEQQGSPLALNRPSRKGHQLISISDDYPWTIQWQRPAGVPWTHLQLVERLTPTSSQEQILADVYTQNSALNLGQLGGAWMSQTRSHWVRIANAYDSSSQYTDAGSWRVFPLHTNYQELPTPKLKEPTDASTLTRAQQGSTMNFFWQQVPGATQYQLSIFRSEGNQWLPIFNETTAQTSITIPTTQISGGKFRWMVTASSTELKRSQSESWTFTLNAGDPLRIFQVLVDNLPMNGARIAVSPWGSATTQNGITASKSKQLGQVSLAVPAGNADITVDVLGVVHWSGYMPIPADTAIPVILALHRPGSSSLQGIIQDASKLPMSDILIRVNRDDGSQMSVHSGSDGSFRLALAPGSILWSIVDNNGNIQDSGLVRLNSNQNIDLGIRIIQNDLVRLRGSIHNTSREPLAGATVHIQSNDGATRQDVRTDPNGKYSIMLTKGRYLLTCEATSYEAGTQILPLAGNRVLDWVLSSNEHIVSGTVLSSEEAVLGTPLQRPLQNAEILVWNLLGSADTIRTQSDAQGYFVLSLPNQDGLLLAARHNGKISKSNNLSANNNYRNLQLVIPLEARVTGLIAGTTGRDSAVVLLSSNGAIIATTTAYKLSKDTLQYTFRDISPRKYQVEARAPGYQQTDTVTTEVSILGGYQGRGTVQVPLISMQSTSTKVALFARAKLQALAATWQVAIPIDTMTTLPDTLMMGAGRLYFHVIPADHSWIPLWNASLTLPATGLILDTVQFIAQHTAPKSLSPFGGDSLRLTLKLLQPIDSVKLHILDAGLAQERTLSPQVLTDTLAIFEFIPQSHIQRLVYWFDVFASNGNLVFSNPPPLRNYAVPIDWPAFPYQLSLDQSDTLRLSVGAFATLQGYASTVPDAQDYTQILKKMGLWTWKETNGSGLAITPDSLDKGIARVTVGKPGTFHLKLETSLGAFSDTAGLVILARNAVNGTFTVQSAHAPQPLAGDSFALQAVVIDTSKQEWIVPAIWSVEPSTCGTLHDAPAFAIASDFLGPCHIFASYFTDKDTLDFDVMNALLPNSPAQHFVYDSAVQVWSADTAWKGPNALLFGLARFTGLRKVGTTIETMDTVNGFYNLKFPGLIPLRSPRLAWNIAQAGSNGRTLYRLDSMQGTWSKLDSLPSTDSSWIFLQPPESLPILYGLLANPDTIRTASLSLMPNPFSPFVTALIDGNTEPGTALHFVPYIPGTSQTVVHLEILSLNGEPMRTLVDDQIMKVQEHVMYWDGLTDSGHMARNGRYLALLTLRKNVGGKIITRIAKPVVVFK